MTTLLKAYGVFCIVIVSFWFSGTHAASTDYLSADEVKERLFARPYYIGVTGPELGHPDVPGTVAIYYFRFHETGKYDYQIFAPDSWRSDGDWEVKPDGRFCMPNRKGKVWCLFVRAEDNYLKMFNRQGKFIYQFSPHSHGR